MINLLTHLPTLSWSCDVCCGLDCSLYDYVRKRPVLYNHYQDVLATDARRGVLPPAMSHCTSKPVLIPIAYLGGKIDLNLFDSLRTVHCRLMEPYRFSFCYFRCNRTLRTHTVDALIEFENSLGSPTDILLTFNW